MLVGKYPNCHFEIHLMKKSITFRKLELINYSYIREAFHELITYLHVSKTWREVAYLRPWHSSKQ